VRDTGLKRNKPKSDLRAHRAKFSERAPTGGRIEATKCQKKKNGNVSTQNAVSCLCHTSLRNNTDVKSIQPYAKNVRRSLKNDSVETWMFSLSTITVIIFAVVVTVLIRVKSQVSNNRKRREEFRSITFFQLRVFRTPLLFLFFNTQVFRSVSYRGKSVKY